MARLPGFRASLARISPSSLRPAATAPAWPRICPGRAPGPRLPGGLPGSGSRTGAPRPGLARPPPGTRRRAHRRPGPERAGTIWLDGFHALPDPDLARRLRPGAACRCHSDARRRAKPPNRRAPACWPWVSRKSDGRRARPRPRLALVRAPGIEREAEEIARRILEQAAAGRPFREMGIVVRAAGNLRARSALHAGPFRHSGALLLRFPLDRHAVTRFLAGAVDAMLGGWDHARPWPCCAWRRASPIPAPDRFDFAVREQLPNAGLGALKRLAGEGDRCDAGCSMRWPAIEEWRAFSLTPKDWAARFAPAQPLPAARSARDRWRPIALEWRSQAAVLDAVRRGPRRSRRRARSGARHRHRGFLARREIGAAPHAPAPAGRPPQRGPRAQRARSPPVGAAGGVRLRHGGKAVPPASTRRTRSSRTPPAGA